MKWNIIIRLKASIYWTTIIASGFIKYSTICFPFSSAGVVSRNIGPMWRSPACLSYIPSCRTHRFRPSPVQKKTGTNMGDTRSCRKAGEKIYFYFIVLEFSRFFFSLVMFQCCNLITSWIWWLTYKMIKTDVFIYILLFKWKKLCFNNEFTAWKNIYEVKFHPFLISLILAPNSFFILWFTHFV